MKNNNVIDLTNYFVQTHSVEEENRGSITARKLFHMAGRILDIASTAAIAICLCACLLLFFTML